MEGVDPVGRDELGALVGAAVQEEAAGRAGCPLFRCRPVAPQVWPSRVVNHCGFRIPSGANRRGIRQSRRVCPVRSSITRANVNQTVGVLEPLPRCGGEVGGEKVGGEILVLALGVEEAERREPGHGQQMPQPHASMPCPYPPSGAGRWSVSRSSTCSSLACAIPTARAVTVFETE